jgi:ABC-type phosphate transport system substrate-binding protein
VRLTLRALNRIGRVVAGLAVSLAAATAAAEVVAVVSARSAVTSLSRNQVADIFLGKAARFPDGSPAVAIDQAEGAAARDEFYLKVAGKSAAQLNAHWSKIIFTGRGQPPREVANDAAVKKVLLENPAAIGYIDRSLVDAGLRVVSSE